MLQTIVAHRDRIIGCEMTGRRESPANLSRGHLARGRPGYGKTGDAR